MALRETQVSYDYVKSYATKAALLRKIESCKDEWAENDDRYFIVRTPEGRWTAIVILDKLTGGYVGRYDFIKV
jgi:hypothetical protein